MGVTHEFAKAGTSALVAPLPLIMSTDAHPDLGRLFETALAHHQAGRAGEAEPLYRRVLAVDPTHPEALHLLGLLRHQAGKTEEAIALVEQAIRHAPPNEHLLNNLGQIYKAAGRMADAAEFYRKAIALNPRFAEAYNNLGNALFELGAVDEAIAAYRQALTAQPRYVMAQYNLATAFMQTGASDEAATLFEAVIATNPGFADAHNNLGLIWLHVGRTREAATCFERAARLNPNHADALSNLGQALFRLGARDEAESALRRVLGVNPRHAGALNNFGNVMKTCGRLAEALASYEQALAREPEHPEALSNLVFVMMLACAWKPLAAYAARLDRLTQADIVSNRKTAEPPFLNVTRHADPALNVAVARTWSRDVARRVAALREKLPASIPYPDGRLTVAYLSSDFRHHAIGHMMQNMLAHHDRKSFRILCYSSRPDDDSIESRTIRGACDSFVDIHDVGHVAAASRLRQDGVNILVDLNGFTQGARPEIAALRPAPVQIVHLYTATTGADFFDYIIADRTVIPEEGRAHVSEAPIYLPHCFLPGPGALPPPSTGRAPAGLPEDAFVLCSFNQSYKYDPDAFAVWMRLLKRRDNAILWLPNLPELTRQNLCREAEAQNVSGVRLLFAPTVAKADHLARLALADLALDTRIYGGHLTTSDALCMGVPVVVLRGRHFASRLSTSIVAAAGAPELAVDTLAAYEELACTLMDSPPLRRSLKERLLERRASAPFFDIGRYVRGLEDGYRQAWGIFRRGEKPRPIIACDTV